MKVGDQVRFRKGSRAWNILRLRPDTRGEVVEIFSDPENRGSHTADVKFPGSSMPRRGIDVDELEVISCGSDAERLAANF